MANAAVEAAVASIRDKWNSLSGLPPDITEELDTILDAAPKKAAPAEKPAESKPAGVVKTAVKKATLKKGA